MAREKWGRDWAQTQVRGCVVTKADAGGSEEAPSKPTPRAGDEGELCVEAEKDETPFGARAPPPAASPLCSGPVSSSACEVLNTPSSHPALLKPAPPAIWWLGAAALHKHGQCKGVFLLIFHCTFVGKYLHLRRHKERVSLAHLLNCLRTLLIDRPSELDADKSVDAFGDS